MNLKIKSITLENFKGVREKTINLDGKNAIISGQNGAGKTTVADAYFWVFNNTNYALKSNPDIYPLNAEECTPSVEIVMTIDDKPVTIRKSQARKVTENNGTRKVALTNTYAVNSVPMSERDMQKKLSDMGFDFEKFATLTNPNSFLAEKKDVQRSILFGMASNYTDLEIASKMDGVDEAAEQLKSYTMDEIKAMANATLKKITEVYGRKGEIWNARIEGLELSKTDMDFAEVELNKNLLTQKLEANRDAQRVARAIDDEINKLHSEDMELQFKVSGLNSQIDAENKAQTEKQLSEKKNAQEKAFALDNDIRRYTNEVEIYEHALQTSKAEKETLEKRLAEAKALTMDVSKTVCPVCNRPYDEQKIGEIRAEFEKEKAKHISDTETWISENESLTAIKRAELTEIKRKLEKTMIDRQALESTLNKPVYALQEASEKVQALLSEINTLNAEIETKRNLIKDKESSKPNMRLLTEEESVLVGQIRDCEIQLSKATLNVEIDEKIDALRSQQREFEQSRADNEKILYQLDEIQKRKNELLTEEINKHFDIVKFVFFTYLKNGSYTETCTPMTDGKALGSATNTGLEIRAKLDIINGLQKFYGLSIPVMLDGSEALDDTSMSKIQMDCQMVYLKVTEDKELMIKGV